MKHSDDAFSALPYAVDITKQIIEAQNQIIRNEGRTSVMPTHGIDDLIDNLNGFATKPHTFTLKFELPPIDPVESGRRYTPKRIMRSGPATIVFWEDGTKTIVKRAPDEPDNEYAAFTAAMAVKIFGSNSKVKKIIKTKTGAQK